MTNLLIVFALLIALHALYNLINFLRFPHIEALLIGNYTNDAKLKMKAKSHKNTILNYIKYAGIKDKTIPISQPLGLGQIATGNVSIFQNLLNQREDFAFHAMDCLLEAKGNYWSNFLNSVNPFYWLRIFLYIPRNILTYLGVNSESILIKIFQLIYWLVGVIFTVLISVFPEEIKAFIFSTINLF